MDAEESAVNAFFLDGQRADVDRTDERLAAAAAVSSSSVLSESDAIHSISSEMWTYVAASTISRQFLYILLRD